MTTWLWIVGIAMEALLCALVIRNIRLIARIEYSARVHRAAAVVEYRRLADRIEATAAGINGWRQPAADYPSYEGRILESAEIEMSPPRPAGGRCRRAMAMASCSLAIAVGAALIASGVVFQFEYWGVDVVPGVFVHTEGGMLPCRFQDT